MPPRSRTFAPLVQRLLALAVGGVALGACAEPMRFYPRGGFMPGLLPSRPPETVRVFFDGERPDCEPVTLGVLTYDAARDGVTSSRTVVVDALQARAGRLGATGISNLVLTGSGVTGAGVAIGNAMFSSSVQEFSASGLAYVCAEELRGRGR